MLWPNILSQVALYVTLHQPDMPSDRWKMPRVRFFWISFWAVFVYTWIPEVSSIFRLNISLDHL